jgi:hypothetical protein
MKARRLPDGAIYASHRRHPLWLHTATRPPRSSAIDFGAMPASNITGHCGRCPSAERRAATVIQVARWQGGQLEGSGVSAAWEKGSRRMANARGCGVYRRNRQGRETPICRTDLHILKGDVSTCAGGQNPRP